MQVEKLVSKLKEKRMEIAKAGVGADLDRFRGFHSHGGTPIAGWFN